MSKKMLSKRSADVPIRARGSGDPRYIPCIDLIRAVVVNREAIVTQSGALAVWNPANSTGRIPKQTFIVRDSQTEESVDWNFSACNPMKAENFDRLFRDTKKLLAESEHAYVTERAVGADPRFALPVRMTTNRALTALFTHNMFIDGFGGDPFELLVFSRAQGDQCVAMDFHRRRGVVLGTSYLGCVKKLMFTVMNHLLPGQGILPLHCSATEDEHGDTHLFLGLSGTGKTTLSSDPRRKLIGDDEHFWSDDGIANMENGCYAKLINLSREKEPEIHQAVFGGSTAIIENAMVYPDGSVDVTDGRLTENSRASYPLSSLKNVKKGGCGIHPKTILFLTADASGVLPPIARLDTKQALHWFFLGYTSKLAGTETGVTTPQSTFSRFFGGPFMPRKPEDYLKLFRKKIEEHGTGVYLVNTGWSGGPYGVGKRMDIAVTRKLVDAAIGGSLKNVEYREDKCFDLFVPKTCPHVDSRLLDPEKTWKDRQAFEDTAKHLANEFKRVTPASAF